MCCCCQATSTLNIIKFCDDGHKICKPLAAARSVTAIPSPKGYGQAEALFHLVASALGLNTQHFICSSSPTQVVTCLTLALAVYSKVLLV